MILIDKLFDAVAAKGNVCIGLDTAFEYIPREDAKNYSDSAAAVLAYNRAIIDAASGYAACFKVQIAYYEELGLAGLKAYSETLQYLRKKGHISIADIKRGDIADTASRYAKAHFYGDFEADFVTLNPYMGMDTLTPWISLAEKCGKGAFVLLRTSNPGRADFECQKLKSGNMLYETLGENLSVIAGEKKGMCGFGIFGAVTGCTETAEAQAMREKFSNLFFLIPGYGAQGGAADDAALLLKDGNGGIVNASRSILKAWEKSGTKISCIKDAAQEAANAAQKMRDDIRAAVQKAAKK
ncbi:MAG: orotidine-5'-phosphate decarboxylase [Spirochaetaceae bacterium]|jgi:orotidine-5'-phosphate decarboxylase|nr:orotidine-5'-phosphate decarboxylase [Spirochaetaceae bacterium]